MKEKVCNTYIILSDSDNRGRGSEKHRDADDDDFFFFFLHIQCQSLQTKLLNTILQTTILHLQERYQGEQKIMTTPWHLT